MEERNMYSHLQQIRYDRQTDRQTDARVGTIEQVTLEGLLAAARVDNCLPCYAAVFMYLGESCSIFITL